MAKGAVRVGRRFGRLEVLGEDEPYFWRGRFSRRRWLCACDCGGEAVVREDRLMAGTTLSCGCLRVEAAEGRLLRHGGRAAGRATPEYRAWLAMLHGSGGAAVCRRWRAGGGRGFLAFRADLGPRPGPGYRLVRRDASRAYAPGNCRWLAGVPRRGVPRRLVEYRGRVVTLAAAAAASGVGYGLLCKRLERGWPLERALRPARRRADGGVHRLGPPARGEGNQAPDLIR